MAYGRGTSGNPGGYSRQARAAHREFARRIRELTNDGEDMIDALIEIADIGPNARPDMRTNSPAEKKVRLEAIAMLKDRMLGRVPMELDVIVDVHDSDRAFAPLSDQVLGELAGAGVIQALSGAVCEPDAAEPEDAELVEDE